MRSITVTLAINTQEFSRLYRGQARDVICTSKDGRTVQFPANALRQYLTHDGVYGDFEIFFTNDNKLAKIAKLK